MVPNKFWYERAACRLPLLVAMGACFVGAMSLYSEASLLRDVPGFQVMSSGSMEAGESAGLRLSARMLDSQEPVTLHVEELFVDDQPAAFTQTGLEPALLNLKVPYGVSGTGRLRMKVRTQGHVETVSVPIEFRHPDAFYSAVDSEGALAKQRDAFRIDVLPKTLTMGMGNRLYVLIRHPDGSPARGVDVQLRGPGHRSVGRTNEHGIMTATFDSPPPHFEVRVEASRRGQKTGTWERLKALGRGFQLSRGQAVGEVTHPFHVSIDSVAPSLQLYCELRQGAVWRQVWEVTTQQHRGELVLSGLEEGLFHLQCSTHFLKSGNGVDSLAIVIGTGDPERDLRTLLTKNRIWSPSPAPPLPATRLTRDFWVESLEEPEVGAGRPLALTHARAEARRLQERDDRQTRVQLLFVALFGLLGAFLAELLLGRRDAQRRFYLALAASAEASGLPGALTASPVTRAFDRTRAMLSAGVWTATAGLGLLIAFWP